MRIRKTAVFPTPTMSQIAQVSDALAHPVRIMILQYVMQNNSVRNDVCNRDLVAHLDYSQATVSQHVKKLVSADLLQTKKQDRFTFYEVNRDCINQYVEQIRSLEASYGSETS